MNLHPPLLQFNARFTVNPGVWRFCGLASFVLLLGCSSGSPPASVAEKDSTTAETSPMVGTVTVEIVIDPEDVAKTVTKQVEIKDGQTLESVMADLDGVTIQSSGSGVTAFIQSINGVETTADRGWTYTIDGDFAPEGIGSTKLVPGQTVQWKFATFEEAIK